MGRNLLGHRRRRNTTRKSLYLWEFLFGLLEDSECTPFICWTNKRDGEFALKDTDELAKLWGTVKNRPLMDKDKLFRAIRTYYNRGMLRKVKGHKGVYQFLSIPYEAEGFDHEAKTCSETYGTPPMVASPEDSSTDSSEVTLDCTERLAGDGEMTPVDNCGTAVDCRDSTEDNSETTVETRVKVENGFDQPYRSRAQSWSEYSMSSDSSSKSLEELQADLLTIDVLDHFSENMDFVFNDDNNVEMCENGELFDLL